MNIEPAIKLHTLCSTDVEASSSSNAYAVSGFYNTGRRSISLPDGSRRMRSGTHSRISDGIEAQESKRGI